MAAFLLGKQNPISKLYALIEVTMQPNMTSRKLRSGQTAYYWRQPRGAKTHRLPLHAEPLGVDFVEAVIRARKLNAIYADCKKAKKIKTH
jgi:hypothetical protein